MKEDEDDKDVEVNDTKPAAPKTAYDHYADFIGQQVKNDAGSPFSSKGMKPVSRDDINQSTGKTSKKSE